MCAFVCVKGAEFKSVLGGSAELKRYGGRIVVLGSEDFLRIESVGRAEVVGV